MRCCKQVAGWPVVDSEGKEIGRVEQLLVNKELKLTGILIKTPGADELSQADIEEVVFGDHLLWLASGSCFKPAENGENSVQDLLGKDVLDIYGNVSGIAYDFVVDPVRKTIVGLEMSDGLVSDWLQGRQVAESGSLQFDGQQWITVGERKEGAEGIQ